MFADGKIGMLCVRAEKAANGQRLSLHHSMAACPWRARLATLAANGRRPWLPEPLRVGLKHAKALHGGAWLLTTRPVSDRKCRAGHARSPASDRIEC